MSGATLLSKAAGWAKARPGQAVAAYIFMAWLSGGYAYRNPVMIAIGGGHEPAIEAFFAATVWPIYWFFRSMTVGF